MYRYDSIQLASSRYVKSVGCQNVGQVNEMLFVGSSNTVSSGVQFVYRYYL